MSHNFIFWSVAKVWFPWLPTYDLIGWCFWCSQRSSIRARASLKSVPEQKYSYKYFKILHNVDYNCPVWEDGAWSVMIECLCHQEQTMLLIYGSN